MAAAVVRLCRVARGASPLAPSAGVLAAHGGWPRCFAAAIDPHPPTGKARTKAAAAAAPPPPLESRSSERDNAPWISNTERPGGREAPPPPTPADSDTEADAPAAATAAAAAAAPADGEAILGSRLNAAARYVYLRTLPLAAQQELAGDEVALADAITVEAGRHLAALAVATHHVLLPRLGGDEPRVAAIIRAALAAPPDNARTNGGSTAPPPFTSIAYWLMRARLMFAASPLGAVRGMTTRAAADWGAAFATDTTNDAAGGPNAHVLRVRSCLYHAVCAAEGVPSLTRVFCALDAALFAPVSDAGRGLTFALEGTLAEGAEACVFRFGSARDVKGGLRGG